jgi:hypothetical protein
MLSSKKTLIIVAAVALLVLLAVYVRGGECAWPTRRREGYSKKKKSSSKKSSTPWIPAPPPLDTLAVPLLPVLSEFGGRFVALPGKGENTKLGTKSQMIWDKNAKKAYWYRTGGTFSTGATRPPRMVENLGTWK